MSGDPNRFQLFSRELDRQISGFDSGRRLNKKRALFFKLSITGLGGLTTVALGLQGEWERELLHNLALVFTALTTMLSAWDAFFSHRALWVRYTTTSAQLKSIKFQLSYQSAGSADGPDATSLDGLVAQFQEVLRSTNDWWLHQRESDGPPHENQ